MPATIESSVASGRCGALVAGVFALLGSGQQGVVTAAGLVAGDLDGIFVTHEHGDHIGCVHALARRSRIPVWMSEGTWLATGGHHQLIALLVSHDLPLRYTGIFMMVL